MPKLSGEEIGVILRSARVTLRLCTLASLVLGAQVAFAGAAGSLPLSRAFHRNHEEIGTLAFELGQPPDSSGVDGSSPVPPPEVPDETTTGKQKEHQTGGGSSTDTGEKLGKVLVDILQGPTEPNFSALTEELQRWLNEHAENLWTVLRDLLGDDAARLHTLANREGPQSTIFRKIKVRTETIEKLFKNECQSAVDTLAVFSWDRPAGIPNVKTLDDTSRRWLESQDSRLYSVLAAVTKNQKDVLKQYRKRVERKRTLPERVSVRTEAILAIARGCVGE